MKLVNILRSKISYVIILLVFVVLYLFTFEDYLVFHFLTEMFTIIIAGAVFVITINTREYFKNHYMIFIGISYFFIAILDTFHTLTYTGMPIYTHLNYPANQLWIAARFYEAVMLLSAFAIVYGKTVNTKRVIIINLIVTTILLSSILWLDIFPACFIEGQGQTTFKIVSEYIISAILLMTLVFIRKRKDDFNKRQYVYLNLALISTIISELLFTFYISNYGISNLFGHYFKVISFIFIYVLIIKEGLQEPYSLIFKELEKNRKRLHDLAHLDPLTNLANRRSAIQSFDILLRQSKRDKKAFSLLIIDIDDFKKYNDAFGHTYGDEILIKISNMLLTIGRRPLDVVSRHGGEEFIILLSDCDYDGATQKSIEIHMLLKSLEYKETSLGKPTVSIGYVSLMPKDDLLLDELVNIADEQMYKAKSNGKNCSRGKQL